MISLKQIQSNLNMIEFRGLELYFSYETLVMVFQYKLGVLYIREEYSDYSRTTTRHINKIKTKYENFDVFMVDPETWKKQITYGLMLNV